MKALACAALILASACSSPSTPNQLYLIRREVAPDPASIPANAPKLSLPRPQVAEHIDGLTLVRMDGRVDHLYYSRFAAPIADIVSEWMANQLTASGSVRWALPAGLANQADLSLQLRVLRFELEEVAPAAGGLRAEVLLEAILVNGLSHEIIATTRARGGLTATGNTPAALVKSLREALQQAADSLAASLTPHLVTPEGRRESTFHQPGAAPTVTFAAL
jgi:ABC-type uncharacterized transport system auxiliary subunit